MVGTAEPNCVFIDALILMSCTPNLAGWDDTRKNGDEAANAVRRVGPATATARQHVGLGVCADLVPSRAARLLSLADIPDLVLIAPRSTICSSAESAQRRSRDFAGCKHGLRVGTDSQQPRMRKSAPAPAA